MNFISYRKKPTIVQARRVSKWDKVVYDVARGRTTINDISFYSGSKPKVGDYIIKCSMGGYSLRSRKTFEKDHVVDAKTTESKPS